MWSGLIVPDFGGTIAAKFTSERLNCCWRIDTGQNVGSTSIPTVSTQPTATLFWSGKRRIRYGQFSKTNSSVCLCCALCTLFDATCIILLLLPDNNWLEAGLINLPVAVETRGDSSLQERRRKNRPLSKKMGIFKDIMLWHQTVALYIYTHLIKYSPVFSDPRFSKPETCEALWKELNINETL